MAFWVQVNDTDTDILFGPADLPKFYRAANGSIVSLEGLEDEELFDLKWYRWLTINEAFNAPFQSQTGPVLEFERGKVIATFTNTYFDLDTLKEVMKSSVNDHRDAWMDGGWHYNGIHYDSDAQARQNMTGTMTLINTGYVLPENFTWRSADNEDISFDNTTFTQFYQSSCAWMEMIYQTSWYHKAQIDALTGVEDVISYQYKVGWPVGYPFNGAQFY